MDEDGIDVAGSRAAPADGAWREPEALGSALLGNLVRACLDGIAVLDVDRRYVYVNPPGCRILGATAERLAGQPAPFLPAIEAGPGPAAEPHDSGARLVVVSAADGSRRELEYTESTLELGDSGWIAVIFRDVSETQRQQRRLAAFARTASSLAYAGSLQTVLDRVAAEVVPASGVVACAIVLIDPETHEFRMAGTAGHRDDYLQHLEEARRLGAPLIAWRAYESRQPLVRRDVQLNIGDDPRRSPMREIVREAAWHSVVAVPLVVRDEGLGVLTGHYSEGEPTDADISFLTAIADQTAVAVHNARLFAELESKAALEERHRLARELHDSVSQALFSMTLQARAVQLATQRQGEDAQRLVVRGVTELRELTQGALAEMRALIFQLRPGALHEEGLVAAVRKHAAAVAARADLEVRVNSAEDRLPLTERAEEELFRIVQEAVHNSVKHAQPSHVEIRLHRDVAEPATLVVEIADDGVGFDPHVPHPGHLGLDNMRQRTERLGGRLSIDSSPAGSTIRAVLPGLLLAPEITDRHDASSPGR
jgi:signal transduction histidine kinase